MIKKKSYLEIKIKSEDSKKYLIEVDADALERIAGDLGLFKPEFEKELEEAERDYKEGRFRELEDPKDLR